MKHGQRFGTAGEQAAQRRVSFITRDQANQLGQEGVYQNDTNHDPSLTSNGLEQAQRAGAYFKRRIRQVSRDQNVNFDEIIVESSPFLKCLQTATAIASVNSIPNVHVQYRVCDTLTKPLFEKVQGNVMEELDLKKSGAFKLKNDALGGEIEVDDT